MITISPAAQAHFQRLLQAQAAGTHIRVFVVQPGTPQAECGICYCPPESVQLSDKKIDFKTFSVYIDPISFPYLKEAVVDFHPEQMGVKLTIKAPHAQGKAVNETPVSLFDRIDQLLQLEINPQLALHGGQVTLTAITPEKKALLRLSGGCNGCAMASTTVKTWLEKRLLAVFPELSGVEDTTEHQAGAHSYY